MGEGSSRAKMLCSVGGREGVRQKEKYVGNWKISNKMLIPFALTYLNGKPVK
jgi:hypothetical protein